MGIRKHWILNKNRVSSIFDLWDSCYSDSLACVGLYNKKFAISIFQVWKVHPFIRTKRLEFLYFYPATGETLFSQYSLTQNLVTCVWYLPTRLSDIFFYTRLSLNKYKKFLTTKFSNCQRVYTSVPVYFLFFFITKINEKNIAFYNRVIIFVFTATIVAACAHMETVTVGRNQNVKPHGTNPLVRMQSRSRSKCRMTALRVPKSTVMTPRYCVQRWHVVATSCCR